MNETRYDILIPEHTEISIVAGKLRPTQAEAQAILDQCKAIVEKKEERAWRDGDIIRNGTVSHIRVQHRWRIFDCRHDMYFGNLADIIKQGPIVVGHTVIEAEHLAGGCVISRTCVHRDAIEQKMQSALDAYRKRKAQ